MHSAIRGLILFWPPSSCLQGSASCFSALAFTKHLSGDIDGAIELYHQALSRKPDDPLSTEMLNRALKESLAVTVEAEDSQMTESFATTPADADQTSRDRRMFTPSFNFGTPNNSASWSARTGAAARSASRRGLDLSLDTTDDNPDLSLDSDDADMSMS